jgi:hypothetical protein
MLSSFYMLVLSAYAVCLFHHILCSLLQDAFPTAACSMEAKKTLISQLHMKLTLKEFKTILQRFANACRGF